MKKLGVVAVVAVALLLGGCSSTTAEDSAPEATSGATATVAPEVAVPTTTATGPASTATPDTGSFGLGDYTPDTFFLAMIYKSWPEARPSDQALFDSAGQVCDQLRGGATKDEIVVVDADHNAELRRAAIQVYCPEFG